MLPRSLSLLLRRPSNPRPSYTPHPARYSSYNRSDFTGHGFSAFYDPDQPTRGPLGATSNIPDPHVTPKRLRDHLDRFVVDQDRAKVVLSVAIHEHFLRIQELRRQRDEQARLQAQAQRRASAFRHPVEDEFPGQQPTVDLFTLDDDAPSSATDADPLIDTSADPLQIDKSNVLILGPTGVGKTLMCKTLAKTLGIPISMSDCTTFTQAGYIGDDVEQCVSRLFAAAGQDVEATEHGIIVLDEIDKIASAKMAHGKDVGGEGVQQALLKIIEGTTVQVRAKPEKTSKNPSTTYSGYSTPLDGTRSPMSGGSPSNGKEETYTVRTDNILFICTGAFANLHKIILDRKSMGGIGFGASIRSSNAHASTDGVMLKGAQATLFKKDSPFFVPPEPAPSPFGVQPPAREETVNVLDHIQPADLQKYGMIPELIGRIPTVCAVSSLDEDALVRVLTEPKDSLLRQETHKFFLRNMELRITTPALREIARKAAKMGTGARGLRHVVDSLLLQTKYETPGSSVKHILVTRDVARLKCAPLYFHRGQAAAFSAELARDEEAWDAELRGREDEASGGRGHGQGHGHGHVGSFEEYRKAGAGGF